MSDDGTSGSGGRRMSGASARAVGVTVIGPPGLSIVVNHASRLGQSGGLASSGIPIRVPTERASCQNRSRSSALTGPTQRSYARTLVTMSVACTQRSSSGAIAR